MKKILSVMLACLMLLSCMAVTSFAADDITVTLNGEVVDCNAYGQPATIVEGRTLVPLRAIFEALGATVEWDNVTRTVTSTMGTTSIELTVGADTLYKNGEPVTLDVPGQIINGRTLVPARAIAEAYGVDVDWDPATRTVILTKAQAPAVPEIEGAIISKMTGETYTGEEGAYGENCVGITVVDNPDKPGDKVLYLETNITEKQAWNYFWFPCEWEAGQRYLITFSARTGNDAFGNPIVAASYGANMRANAADKSIGSFNTAGETWKNFATIATAPTDLDTSKDMKFGIFASPVEVAGYDHNLAWSFYLDNIAVVPYDGDLDDGMVDANLVMGPTGSSLPAGFDFDTAKGEEVDLSTLASTAGSYVDGEGFVFKAEGDMVDPLVMITNLSVDAATHPGVAVKFEKGVVDSAVNAQMFFTTSSASTLDETKSLYVYYVACGEDAEGNLIAYFDFANDDQTSSAWNGTVTSLRLDPGNGNGEWTVKGIKFIEG